MSSGEDITHKIGPWITRFGCPRMLRGHADDQATASATRAR
jgi:hypothetical protein